MHEFGLVFWYLIDARRFLIIAARRNCAATLHTEYIPPVIYHMIEIKMIGLFI